VAVTPKVFIQHGEDPQRLLLAGALKARASELGREIEVSLPQASCQDGWHWLEGDDVERAVGSKLP
jgi:hypothetical protein